MIGVNGQYVFKFSLGGETDFIYPDDLKEFVVIEECGNILPAWKIYFYTLKENILQYINEGNILEVSYGDGQNMIDTKLLICKKDIQKVGQKYFIYCAGIYDCLKYITVPHLRITSEKSASEAIEERAKAYFEVEKVDSDESKQNWIQHNQTDKGFINAVAKRAYATNGFFGIGITTDGKFRFVNIDTLANGNADFKFGYSSTELNPIAVKQVSDSGFLNSWAGYQREQLVHDMDKGGKSTKVIEEITSKLAMAAGLNQSTEVSKRYAVLGLLTENMHSKYQHACLRNMQGLASYSVEGLELTILNKFFPIKIFDVAMFKQQSNSAIGSAEAQSGLYVVSLVSRMINRNQFFTVVRLSREASGGQK